MKNHTEALKNFFFFFPQQLALELSGSCQGYVSNLFFTGLRANYLLLKRNGSLKLSHIQMTSATRELKIKCIK